MKKLIILASVLILVGCGGDGSNTTAGAGSATEGVEFGKFRPTKSTQYATDTTLFCKHSNDSTKAQPEYMGEGTDEYYTFNVECKAHNSVGLYSVAVEQTGNSTCVGEYENYLNPKPPKVVKFSCEIMVYRYFGITPAIFITAADYSSGTWFISILDNKYPEIVLP